METYDICVVGFGPTGATAASLLGKAGHSVLVIDQLTDVYDKPRAICIDHEIMRVFQQLGVTDEIVPFVAPYPASEYYGCEGQLIKRLDTAPPPYPLGYAPNLSFLQPPVEEALRRRAASMPNVEVRLGSELIGLVQDMEGVTLHLEGPNGATDVRARYVIACDGANSTVRRLTGLTLDDLGFDEPWLVVDMLVGEEALSRLPDVNVQYCEPQRPATHVVGVRNHRRWEIMLLPGEDRVEAVAEANVWKLLERWLTPADATLWRSAAYRFHAVVAHQWRDGRILLAGDAAHQQPPFLGQGMCQGVRDAANLAWKLDLVLSGSAGEALLDTYGTERSAHVRQLTTIIKTLGKFICEREPEAAGARDAKLIAEMGGSVITTFRQDLMPRLERGAVDEDGGTAVGCLFPQPFLSGGRLLDDATGSGFRLMLDRSVPSERLATLQLPEGTRIVRFSAAAEGSSAGVIDVVEQDGVVKDWFTRAGAIAALVRPDNYVYGVASDVGALEVMVRGAHSRLSLEAPARCASVTAP